MNFWRWSLFAAALSMAGLPIYIHAPKVYVDQYGVDLALLGVLLAGLRALDVVQDPALGLLADRTRAHRGMAVAAGASLMALSMLGLFAISPPLPPLLWFGITMAGLFSGYSFLSICFYAQGVTEAERTGAGGHTILAAWRETGALLGVSVAAVLPSILRGSGDPFGLYALAFALLLLVALVAMRSSWSAGGGVGNGGGLRPVLRDPVARRLLALALVNAAPVAVTSTLFLFFVESRLAAPEAAGPFLILFFVSAAAAAPVWARVALEVGEKQALLAGMGLAILAFGWAAVLGPGDLWPFAIVCIGSGIATGADLSLLPAIFARRMARIAPEASQAFGLWSFVQKATLAIAAGVALPALDAAGFVPGETADGAQARTLTFLYALVPCALKLLAMRLLLGISIDGPALPARGNL